MHAWVYCRAFAIVCLELHRELLDGLMIALGCGEQQPLIVRVVHDDDVVLAAPHTGLIDAHQVHRAHVLLGAGLLAHRLPLSPLQPGTPGSFLVGITPSVPGSHLVGQDLDKTWP